MEQPSTPQADLQPTQHFFLIRSLISLVLVILSCIGMVITDINQQWAWTYWLFLAPIFAVICLYLGWSHTQHSGKQQLRLVIRIIFHWLGLLVTAGLILFFVRIGLLSDINAGLLLLTALALTTFLAGVHMDSCLCIIGVMLWIFAWASAFLEEYLSYSMLPVGIIALVIVLYLHHKAKHRL
ncbi:MAG: hypothetical protein CMF50_09235 [Legionellales bacterium]|nr:hypothetical protein [Legionellales bacterium]|tara:strand:+ start:1604 stop:2149 length:546 start_codon:yes stop_codon:yes gene_type:complete